MTALRAVAETLLFLLLGVLAAFLLGWTGLLIRGLLGGEPGWPVLTDESALLQLIPWQLTSQALVFVGLAVWLRRAKLPAGWTAVELTPPARIAWGLLVGGAMLVAAMAVAGLQWALGFPPEEQSAVVEYLSQTGPLGVIPWLVIAAPLGEEFFFRGYMFPFLHSRAGARVAYAVSALTFAAMHLNPTGIAMYVTIGLVLAWAYGRWRSLTVTFTAHAVYNLTVVLIATYAAGSPA